jgi:hypothetical protein
VEDSCRKESFYATDRETQAPVTDKSPAITQTNLDIFEMDMLIVGVAIDV